MKKLLVWINKYQTRHSRFFIYVSASLMAFIVLTLLVLTLVFIVPGPGQKQTKIILPIGASLAHISKSLAENGMIYHSGTFRMAVRVLGQAKKLKAGEYEIPAHMSAYQLMRLLVSGKTYLHAVTIPEGLTSQQVVELLQKIPFLTGSLKTIPDEGSLLPETYKVRRGIMRAALIKHMQDAQQEFMSKAWGTRVPHPDIMSIKDAIIVASIVQKETGRDDEYGLVASVFLNRLDANMRLQSDPTIIYGLVGGQGTLHRPIRLSELNSKTAYNTYKIDGLPPTPIANPGVMALLAVLHFPQTPYFYFVADGKGGHLFAKTLAEHEKNVQRWRRIRAFSGKN